MAVIINSGPVSPTHTPEQLPESKWRELIIARRDFMGVRLAYDCRCLVQFVNDVERLWKPLGYKDADDLIRKGYELNPEEIHLAVDWLRIREPEIPISLPQAIEAALKARGKRGKKRPCNTGSLGDVNDVAYVKARLRRDRPDLADKVKEGELSANAAAIQAGFRKRTISIPEDPQRAAASVKRNFGAQFALEMARCLASEP